MPKICVEIEVDEDGSVLVGMVPPEQEQGGEGAPPAAEAAAGAAGPDQGEEEAEKAYMKPVKDIASALQVAGDMLQGQSGAQAQAAQAEGDFQKGFAGKQPMGSPAPAMPAKPGYGG